MSKDQLVIIVRKVLLHYFSNHSIEVNDHYLTTFLTRSPSEVHTLALELINSVSFWLKKLRIIAVS
jgi:hypothetical protein